MTIQSTIKALRAKPALLAELNAILDDMVHRRLFNVDMPLSDEQAEARLREIFRQVRPKRTSRPHARGIL